MAILAGDTGGSTQFRGGFENLVRLHEDWTGEKLEVTGSFVCLFESGQAMGVFQQGGSVFEPPDLRLKFDSKFQQVAKLPPFTPCVSLASTIFWRDV